MCEDFRTAYIRRATTGLGSFELEFGRRRVVFQFSDLPRGSVAGLSVRRNNDGTHGIFLCSLETFDRWDFGAGSGEKLLLAQIVEEGFLRDAVVLFQKSKCK